MWATDKVAPCSVNGTSSPMAPPLGGVMEVMSELPKVKWVVDDELDIVESWRVVTGGSSSGVESELS